MRSGWRVFLFGMLFGCDEVSPAAPAPARLASPSASAVYTPPPAEGCARAGPLEGLANDAACIIVRADEQATREALKRLSIHIDPEPETIPSGGTAVLRLSIANVSSSDALLPLDAHPAGDGPRPEWSRLSGVAEPRAPAAGDHFVLPLATLDAREKPVDGFQPAPWSPSSTKLVGIRLRPGAKLTHVVSWWALRIPAPLPPFRTDAGYRIVPKTAPVPLPKGEYVIRVELPIHGLSAAERSILARVRVEPAKPPP